MNKLIGIGVLLLLLAACAPGAGTGESWARAIFAPSNSTVKSACNIAIDLFGKSDFETNVGEIQLFSNGRSIRFVSAPGDATTLCGLLGGLVANGDRTSFFDSSLYTVTRDMSHVLVVVNGNDVDIKTASLSISLEDETGASLGVFKAPSSEGVLPGVRFDFEHASFAREPQLDRVASFTIIVNRGTAEERYKVTSQMYSALIQTKDKR
jgi:hypothetical protein